MRNGKWLAVAAVVAAAVAPGIRAGELSIGIRFGGTNLDVDGELLVSGDSISDRGLFAGGYSLAYRWEQGPMIEAMAMASAQPFPIFGFSDLKHISVGGGWQFDLGNWWHFTPKAGVVYTELEALQEDIWTGGEPIQRFHDVVPFVEASFEGRVYGRFGIGVFARRNFEKFGDSQTVGIFLGWTFK
jgi:hypothetical protein